MDYVYFLLETFTVVLAILFCFAGMLALMASSKGKRKSSGVLEVVSLTKKLDEQQQELEKQVLSKPEYKLLAKQRKADLKQKLKQDKLAAKNIKKDNKSKSKSKSKSQTNKILKNKEALDSFEKNRTPKVFVINFKGDIQASSVSSLKEQVSAICQIAAKGDEVICTIDSGGGAVNAYGLATSQLERLKACAGLKLIVAVDKVAASGGYLMAAVADQIVCAPFAIIGSIGVLLQLPNFNKLLESKGVDFEQVTSGKYKRTLTMFGKNTPAGRKKVGEEITNVHDLFKESILKYRPKMDISKVATGEYWLGSDALGLKLVDKLGTSDDLIYQAYLAKKELYELNYTQKKGLMAQLSNKMQLAKNSLYGIR